MLASQSAPSAEGGEALGYDADNRIRGRKRHLLIETGGLLLRSVAHGQTKPGTIHDCRCDLLRLERPFDFDGQSAAPDCGCAATGPPRMNLS